MTGYSRLALLLGVTAAVVPRVAGNSAIKAPTVLDSTKNVTYEGLNRNGIEVFLGIPYGQDTGGSNRFKPPVPLAPVSDLVINAQSSGPACPQTVMEGAFPFGLTDLTVISEDCLHLNVARPRPNASGCGGDEVYGNGEGLPVMVYIHGGSFWYGQKDELVIAPDGLVLESVENGTPVIHVAMNYRLGGELL